MSKSGVIARYRDFLDLPHKDQPVTLNEGDTPLIPLPRLGAELGCALYAKFEGLNPTGSFKDRGSCLKLQRLAQQPDPPKGVAAASAGNHAQGVAYHARRLGLPALIVMPLYGIGVKPAGKGLGCGSWRGRGMMPWASRRARLS